MANIAMAPAHYPKFAYLFYHLVFDDVAQLRDIHIFNRLRFFFNA